MLPILAEAVMPPPQILNPIWVIKPGGDDFARFYPDAAVRQSKAGRVVAECVATAAGDLTDCRTLTVNPDGLGFAEATLKLAMKFHMKATDGDGLAVGGRRVRIPILWVIPGAPAPALDVTPLAISTACLGQVANLAEKTPADPAAWGALAHWTAQFDSQYGFSAARPSEVEAREKAARLQAAAGTLDAPKGVNLAACLSAVP